MIEPAKVTQPSQYGHESGPLEKEFLLFDTLLYTKKLNGAVGAQVVGGKDWLIVPTFNKRLLFLEPTTGREITSILTVSSVGAAAVVAGELLYYVEESGGDALTCLNLVNGKNVWKFRLVDSHGAPVIDGEKLFITSRDGKIFCLNRWTGKVEWEVKESAQFFSSPAIDSSRLFLGSDQGDLICLDRMTGKTLWRTNAGSAIVASPAVAGFVYIGSTDGNLYAYEIATGTLAWKFSTLGQIQTTPVIVGNLLLFGSNDKIVYCLNATDGGILWRFETDGIIRSSPLATESSFIVANSAGSIYQFSHDGQLHKKLVVKGSVIATPSIINERLYIATKKRILYCFGNQPSPQSD